MSTSEKLPAKRKKRQSVGPRFVANIMPWIERYYHAHKTFPSDSLLMSQFRIDKEKLNLLLKSRLFAQALAERGIERRQHLNPLQVATIAVMTNFADTRSIDIKLAAVGVTPEMYYGWMSNPTFKREYQARADEIFDNVLPEANAALAAKVRRGDTSALKMYYEMTGRANAPETVNAQKLVVTVIEAIQKNVKDPVILQAIAREIQGEAPAFASTPVAVVTPEIAFEEEKFNDSSE